MPAPIPQQISRILPKFQYVAQTNHYLVKFGLPPGTVYDPNTLKGHLRSKGVDSRFQLDDVGLLCSSASLPGSAFATINTVGDYQGVVERFAHTRNYTQISLEFYVDNLYKSLKFLEHWMEYISGQSGADPSMDSYHFRMAYPSDYKSNDTRVVKFEKNHFQFLEYRFVGLFPLALNSTRVSYQNSQVLKATATFSYDRYLCGESYSLASALGLNFNNTRGLAGNGNIDYNNTNQLNQILTGLPLLNQNTQFGFDMGTRIDGTRGITGTRTGSDSTLKGIPEEFLYNIS